MERWRVHFSEEGWRDVAALSLIQQEAVFDLLDLWLTNDPPTSNAYDHGFTVRYREPVPTGQWIVYALDTVVDPPSIDVYRIER